MARIDRTHPFNAAEGYIGARKACGVAWQPLPGGMGPLFASLARRTDAEVFIRFHGGAAVRSGQITANPQAAERGSCAGAPAPFFPLAADNHCVTAHDAQARIRTHR